MSNRSGSLMLVKIGSGTNPELFSILAGIKSAQLILNNQYLNASDVASGPWREGRNSGGIQSASINLSGNYTDSGSERLLRQNALLSRTSNFRFYFNRGDYLSGLFHITSFSIQSTSEAIETFTATLQSASTLMYAKS